MSIESYKFKGVPKPFIHQVETMKFIVNTERCFVFNDIGTGKTWSTVWAVDYLRNLGEVQNVLIVAPLSTLEIVWLRTFFHLDATIDVAVLKGTAAKRKFLLGRPGRKVSIINPDALHIISTDEAITSYDMVIVDESAMFRNAKSRRVKALHTICKTAKRVVMMTGSPYPEAPTDIWATARVVCPDRVPRFFGQFRDLTMRKINQFKWIATKDAQDVIAKLLKGFVIRYRRDECIDLPPSQSHEYEVPASKQQTDIIKELRKSAVALIEEGAITAPNEAVVISKILQVASGAVKFRDDDGNEQILETDASGKFDALEELIENSSQPIILFAPYTAVISRIADWLSAKHIPHGVVQGSTHPTTRLENFDLLQSGNIRVLLAHPQAMSHGITLTNANIVVWWTPIYSHEVYEQANGRIVRPGQTRNTYFVHLTCSSLESKVLNRLESKHQLQGVLLEYLQERA